MPDPHRTPAGITRRALDRVLAATRQAEDHDHNNYNVTRPPAPRDQRGDRHVFPVQVIGSEDGTLAGLWPAAVRYWTGYAGGTPNNFADQPGVADCWAFPAPGGADLVNSGEYLGVFVGIHTDGKGVFEVVAAAAAALNSQNTDGTEIDATTTDLRFNKTTGVKVTQSAGVSTVTALAATASQMGAVTTVIQTVGGKKTSVLGTDSLAPGWFTEASDDDIALPWGTFGATLDWNPTELYSALASHTTYLVDVGVGQTTPEGINIEQVGEEHTLNTGTGMVGLESTVYVGYSLYGVEARTVYLGNTTSYSYPAKKLVVVGGVDSGTAIAPASGTGNHALGVSRWESLHAGGTGVRVYQGIDRDFTVLETPYVVGGVVVGHKTGTLSASDVSGLAAVATSGDYADITGGPPATTTVSLSYNSGTKDLTVTVNGVSTVVNLT